MPPENLHARDASAISPARPQSKLESFAFYILIATVVLVPLAFWPSLYVALDTVKVIVIAVGTLLSAILYGIVALRERSLDLPPKSMLWTAGLVAASLIISAFTGIQRLNSFFGQGFEIGTVSFILTLFVAAWVAYAAIRRQPERAVVIYMGMSASFLILSIFHALRFSFGAGFAPFTILTTLTSTVLGSWYNIGIFAALMSIVFVSALSFLPLSRRIRIAYWVMLILSALAAFIVNDLIVWIAAAAVFIAAAVWMFVARPMQPGSLISGWLKRIAWIPLIAGLVSLLFVWRGTTIAGPVITKLNASYYETVLPWQYTLDVTASAIKTAPLFGIGPNHFSQAYLAYKPAIINATPAWNEEFNYGFGFLPSLVATQGVIGVLAWLLFLVFFVVLGVRAFRRLPEDHHARFIVVSSYLGAAYLWIVALIYVPSEPILFYMLILTGIAVGSSVCYGTARGVPCFPLSGTRSYKMMPSFLALCVAIAAVWMLVYIKDTVALAYFGSGVQELTVVGNTDIADADFRAALAWDDSDAYWRARAEANLAKANNLATAASSAPSADASTTQAEGAQIVATLSQAMTYAKNAVSYDPNNYYNYLSEARVSELGATLQIPQAYDAAVTAYTNAIGLDPEDPELYFDLARLEANQNKLDDALKTVGAALQVKNDYLDAVFLLSQIEAAQGNLKDAITAAQVATQLSPSSPVVFFELGLLEYTNKDYSDAAQALAESVKLEPDYANAQYFLGLSYARLNELPEAVAEFQALAKSNPGNQEVSFILTNLEEGKSPFADAQPPVTPNPEKRSTLPINQK